MTVVVDERWYAARRCYDRSHRPRHYIVRILGQPTDGFDGIDDLMGWLAGKGLITRHEDPEEGEFWIGWNDPYCAVSGARDDPWGSER